MDIAETSYYDLSRSHSRQEDLQRDRVVFQGGPHSSKYNSGEEKIPSMQP